MNNGNLIIANTRYAFMYFIVQPGDISLFVNVNKLFNRLSELNNYITWVSSIRVIYEACEWMACI